MITDDQVLKALAVARRVIPASLRPRIRKWMIQWLGLSWRRSSGVAVRLSSYADWILYNAIFVDGEYDPAITKALELAGPGRLHVLDLGANVGLFTLRFVDLLRQVRPQHTEFALTLVEANARLIGELRQRVAENRLAEHVKLIHGLVGERSGAAMLYGGGAARDELCHGSVFPRAIPSGPLVDYVDLGPVLASEPEIHLLKCDIEGAELLFVQHYADLLQKTRVAVFEMHHDLCDTGLCCRLLAQAGFPHHAVLSHRPADSIHCVWR
jgi:FkbM family methyltransferase